MDDRGHATCPYRGLPDERYWRKVVAGVEFDQVQPMAKPKFLIGRSDKIATAGSCFAQHLAKYLQNSGYNYFVSEQAHPITPDRISRDFNYGTFSARFGNIYTTRQFLQMLKRAYGEFQPVEDVWEEKGWLVDPFRPLIQPNGFASREEFNADRESHFAAIRTMVEEADVFIFTLGLTEAWEDVRDGAIFPVCPGCGSGSFSPDKFRLRNLSVTECVQDLTEALAFIRSRNSSVRVILTVSPVPLIATAEDKHVLTATTYSKSVLRVTAEEVSRNAEFVEYFPSFEIITGSYSRGRYFAKDLREVLPEGVEHVMRCFSQTFMDNKTQKSPVDVEKTGEAGPKSEASALVSDIICDEETLITE